MWAFGGWQLAICLSNKQTIPEQGAGSPSCLPVHGCTIGSLPHIKAGGTSPNSMDLEQVPDPAPSAVTKDTGSHSPAQHAAPSVSALLTPHVSPGLRSPSVLVLQSWPDWLREGRSRGGHTDHCRLTPSGSQGLLVSGKFTNLKLYSTRSLYSGFKIQTHITH